MGSTPKNFKDQPSPASTEQDIFLLPGQHYFGQGPKRIGTLLGSCVSLVLWHPRWKLGGMCHFVLPKRVDRYGDDQLDGRYGDEAIQLLAETLSSLGTRAGEYVCRLYGGASFSNTPVRSAQFDVGRRNIECAQRECLLAGFHVSEQQLGGAVYRRLLLDLTEGSVVVGSGSMNENVSDKVLNSLTPSPRGAA